MTRNYNPRKRILMTGGAGFLGSHLIDRILARGDEVICVDNLFTGSKRNIEHLKDHRRFEFMRHDVSFPLYTESGPDLRPSANVPVRPQPRASVASPKFFCSAPAARKNLAFEP